MIQLGDFSTLNALSSKIRPSTVYDKTVVIGLGNPLRGDDGVGIYAIQMLAKETVPNNVEVVDGGTQGLGIINLMEGQSRVIFVDAADVGQLPGQFVRFTLDEAHLLTDDQQLSIHSAGLGDALLLAQTLKMLPPKVIIFGVQPANLDWHNTLSPEVEATLPKLITSILSELVLNN